MAPSVAPWAQKKGQLIDASVALLAPAMFDVKALRA
jgi:hypothetical protein